ncbi:hypothetical protein O6H91_18G058200 [Diphasiastrum complanatum]|nr:hypothetical protein O6H91_18G058200 [Diphasiastrum complanatum]KAJ7523681.1 hypothetical protein O6H91_18G058200 [Diphasiastrum complanatum]
MTELSPVHSYAAGALFALALNQAQIDQQSSITCLKKMCPEHSSEVPTVDLPWTSEPYGLLHHVFRYLKIDDKAWAGLEFTSVSPDAKHHIKAFLRILSENEDDPSTTSGEAAEADLAKAVDAMALTIESPSPSDIPPDDGRNSLVSKAMHDSTKLDNPKSSTNKPSGPMESFADYETTHRTNGEGQENKSSLQVENTCPDVEGSMGTKHETAGRPNDTLQYEGEELSKGIVLTKQRKVAVLYELLAACVADTKEIDGKAVAREGYDARHRVAIRLLATWLDIKWTKVAAMEIMIAYMALAAQKEREANTDEEEEKRKSRWSKWKRGGIIGAAALTGGALLAVTGGLAAPAIAAGLAALAPTAGTLVPVIGATGFAAAAAAAGSAAGSMAVAASFGAAGAGLTGFKTARRTGGVDEFEFEAIGDNHNQGRLAVEIVISGIVLEPKDFIGPWQSADRDMERFALRWETKNLQAVSTAIQDWLTTNLANELMKRGAMMTVLSGLVAAIAWPSALLSATSFIDSTWTIAVDRSDKAGKLLAKCLLKGLHGSRPITLMGFSLGARVIFSCLEQLAAKKHEGIVERVVLLGAPITLDKQHWESVRKVVAGRFVNCYSTNDWILGVVYRASFLTQGLAGLQAVDVPGVENVDITEFVDGHSSYVSTIQTILPVIDVDNYYPCPSSRPLTCN